MGQPRRRGRVCQLARLHAGHGPVVMRPDGDDGAFNELFDPRTSLIRDLTERIRRHERGEHRDQPLASWPHRRVLLAVLVVSLVLNVCFIAGAAWTRMRHPPAGALEPVFQRMPAELGLDDKQRAAFDRYVARDADARRKDAAAGRARCSAGPGRRSQSLRPMPTKSCGCSTRRPPNGRNRSARAWSRRWNSCRCCRPISGANS